MVCFSNIQENTIDRKLNFLSTTRASYLFIYTFFFCKHLTDKYACKSVKGLGLIPGTVGLFDSSNGFRVPHIGWNALQITKDSGILDDVGNHHVYFVHSYRAIPVCLHFPLKTWLRCCCILFLYLCDLQVFISNVIFFISQSDDNKEWVSSTCNYGDNFIASIGRGNVHAVQFHPEKSGGKCHLLSIPYLIFG